MNSHTRKVRALGLCSGGLDSILSALVLRRQEIEVEWVVFETPFFSADKARRASRETGIPLTVQNITSVYLEMLKNPHCGYGQNMNPCLDCHALMFRLAGRIMQQRGFDFMFSGEVLGQRPMSQTRPSLRYVEKHSGYEGLILRPLSAKNLSETIPERQGMIDRERLYDFAGRSRKPQMRLAEELGVSQYPAPGGGCLLTDKGFTRRLKDFFGHRDGWTEEELHLLKHGRHFRLADGTKVIVGRTQKDNEQILGLYRPQEDILIQVEEFPGPVVLVAGGGSENGVRLAAALCAGYSRAPKDSPAEVLVTTAGQNEILRVLPLDPADVKHLIV